MPKVIEGTHADSGRRMQVIISMDTPDSPSDLIATIQGLGEVELSLLALAEAMAASSTRYGQAMARIIQTSRLQLSLRCCIDQSCILHCAKTMLCIS